jgi:adenosylmethionine-8-amino-7-oxononanoate aminotransferase
MSTQLADLRKLILIQGPIYNDSQFSFLLEFSPKNHFTMASDALQVKSVTSVLHRSLHNTPDQVVEASGLWLTLSDGRKILDSTGGAAVACIGHGDERVHRAVAAQMKQVDYCHSVFFSTPASEALAKELIESTGKKMSKALIVNSGKLALEAS